MHRNEMEVRFTYHPPREGQPEKYQTLRSLAQRMAVAINEICPESREKDIAMTKLEESVMWANASVARRE